MFGARQKKHELSLKSGKLVLKYHTGPVNMGNYNIVTNDISQCRK